MKMKLKLFEGLKRVVNEELSVEEVAVWRAYKIETLEEIEAWLAAGFTTAEEAGMWKMLGVMPEEAKELREIGDFETIKMWMDAGFNGVAEIEDWMSFASDIEIAKAWRDVVPEIEDAKLWSAKGWEISLAGIEDITRWKELGMEVEDVVALTGAGLDYDSASAWLGYVADVGQILLFVENDVSVLDIVKDEWIAATVDGGDYIGFKIWLDAGFTLLDAVRWRAAGVDLATAKQKAEAGETAPIWASKGIADENTEEVLSDEIEVEVEEDDFEPLEVEDIEVEEMPFESRKKSKKVSEGINAANGDDPEAPVEGEDDDEEERLRKMQYGYGQAKESRRSKVGRKVNENVEYSFKVEWSQLVDKNIMQVDIEYGTESLFSGRVSSKEQKQIEGFIMDLVKKVKKLESK